MSGRQPWIIRWPNISQGLVSRGGRQADESQRSDNRSGGHRGKIAD